MPRAIGVDVGGTAIKVCIADATGRLSEQRTVPTPHRVEDLVRTVAQQVADLRAHDPGLPVGVAVPGVVDERAGTVVLARNLGWRDVPVRDLLAGALGTDVVLGHDVRAGALAESRWGAGAPDMLFVPIGTGIAAALVLGGRPWGTGYAGEIGQVLVPDPDGGAPVVLEQVASAAALGRRYAARTGGVGADGRGLFDQLRRGDQAAAAVLEQGVTALGTVLAGAVSLLGPVRVVVGGGLAGAGEDLLAPLRARLAELLVVTPVPEVVPAALGPWAGSLGAAALALDATDPGDQERP
ncbi:ROK family protein [Georgenia sp. TF02-10]|uniref:ROK family protein n=1 Tax=Georgenia sp. TF02-10 TaxID=2917725 RepID=UPI001FA73555|nr:ROK family protein [Georgenia sp. TF02-10]UNX55179.1 ROK family protein [Georgenia sp. TF02-10]